MKISLSNIATQKHQRRSFSVSFTKVNAKEVKISRLSILLRKLLTMARNPKKIKMSLIMNKKTMKLTKRKL